MYLGKNSKNNLRTVAIVRTETQRRLYTTCFRGTSLPLAGNFLRWDRAYDLLSDPEVSLHLANELTELWEMRELQFGTHSLNILHSTPVGWESTAPLQDYAKTDLEEFDLNRRSWGLRVKPSRTDLLAPKTNELSIVYEFKSEDGEPTAIIHSMYPGSDVGELYGNVTNREKRVFFDWNHPGAV